MDPTKPRILEADAQIEIRAMEDRDCKIDASITPRAVTMKTKGKSGKNKRSKRQDTAEDTSQETVDTGSKVKVDISVTVRNKAPEALNKPKGFPVIQHGKENDGFPVEKLAGELWTG